MSDVEIIFPNSKAPLAERLREAIARAGYDVAPGGGVAPDEAPEPADAGAMLILWDRSSINQPGLRQAAASARHHGRAIDVSADGITPLDLTDETRLIQLSAWRGDPHHPGWKKILAELERLCGGHRSAPVLSRPAAAAAAAAGPAATAGAPAAASRAKLAMVCVAILLALVLVGFAAMSRRSFNIGAIPPATKTTIAAAQPMAAPTSGTAQAAQPQAPQAPAAALAGPASPINEAAAIPGETVSAPPPVTTQSAEQPFPSADAGTGDRARRPTAHARPKPQRLPGVVRYTKYAKTMRLFCQRSGRHTPQCRLFNQALANGR